MELQKAIVISSMVLMWVSSTYGVYISWKKKKGQASMKTSIFGIFLSLAFMFRISDVYVAFNDFFGVRNLAWLLSYVFGALAIYALVSALTIMRGGKTIWLRRMLIVTLLIMMAVFIPVARGPELVDHTNPQTFAATLYMLVFYLFLAVACIETLKIYVALWRQEKGLMIKLRWSVAACSLLTGTIFFCSRIVYLLIVYFIPPAVDSPVIKTMATVNDVLFFASALGWALFFVPAGIVRVAARLITFVDNIFTFQDLNALRNEVTKLYTPIVETHATWWACLQQFQLWTVFCKFDFL